MKVRIRNLSNFNEETQIKISKTAKISRLKVLAIKPIFQGLYYGGKHLELENTLYDYKINKNDVIQLRMKNNCCVLNNTSTTLTTNKIQQTKEEKNNYENLEDVESDYYTIGDSIDCLDSEYGAWFEATIKRICKSDKELVYIIEWDLVETPQHFYVSKESIRPRANKVIAPENLQVGEKVMINHNLDRPSDVGFWYDFEIEKILSVNSKYILTGILYIGRNHESLYNYQVELREKVYAIAKPKLLKDRIPDNDKYVTTARRPIAPQCYRCYDQLEVNCTECGCVVCGGKNNPHLILVCDECEDEYHISCLKPPLLEIPEDDWYCAKCKTDQNEIVKVGQLVRKRPLNKCEKVSSKTQKSKTKKEKNVPTKKITTKNIPTVPRNHKGAIPGIEVGAWWYNRVQLFHSGMHNATVSGIHGKISDCAYSLILSGNYNDIDNGNEFIYTGAGGHGAKGALSVPIGNQTLTRANKALALNCNAEFNDEVGATATDWRAGIPVRVIRNYKLAKFSQYAPTEGNRYDGLYKVVKYYPEIDKSGFRIWRFLLRRDDPAPPPWTHIDELTCLRSSLSNNNVIESIETKKSQLKVCNKNKKLDDEDKIMSKKKEAEHYYLDSNISRLIEKDYVNSKLWDHCKSYLPNGKKSFLNQVLLSLKCVCCHELVIKPVTTPCAHNICRTCLQKSFAAGIKCCPTCRFNIGTVRVLINKKLTEILSLLFPKYSKRKI
ncbi:E3 ubiquitin-protein ligase UHRF1-like isoform X2 [Phymastichus coffea]|uniref:E3 ubiquitin-protein ligase UHRF1-like isoform X2 n=1 Tax=Phymastichus coffea TaxID=108790 RepID=UPI00273B6C34|nr:E3 ubiquitin-protein ligase UHRF1-like isoform X2 [Phymastichus coffea]